MELQNAIGESDSFQEMMQKVSKLAKVNRPILVLGERGSGKELIASRLHFLSERWDCPYVAVNCAALPDSMLDAELFGSEKGSFTGSTQKRAGRLERADGGTLFLDELATASLKTQEKLLRAIEYGEVNPIGAQKPIQVNVRVVAATNADIDQLIKEKLILPDLLDRLCFDIIKIPPLRERGEDILLLTDFYSRKFCVEINRFTPIDWSDQARQQLLKYPWPGNIRELKNTVERTIFHHEEDEKIGTILFQSFNKISNNSITPELGESIVSLESQNTTYPIEKSFNFYDKIHQIEKNWLKKALDNHQHHQKKAAEALQLTYHQLRGLLRKHNL